MVVCFNNKTLFGSGDFGHVSDCQNCPKVGVLFIRFIPVRTVYIYIYGVKNTRRDAGTGLTGSQPGNVNNMQRNTSCV